MLLGELAIGALDRRSAGAPRHPQDLIGVAHPSRLLHGKIRPELTGDWPALASFGVSVAFLQLPQRRFSSLSPASTALSYEFPNGHGRICRQPPAASFPRGR